MELLAPAGSFEALKAAVSAGADAVYFGGTALNARAFGKNFTNEEIKQAAKYCRLHGVKTYLTLNTLVSDNEIRELIPFLEFINKIGIDAVIVQDLGLASVIKSVAPSLSIHASTQMTIHNLDGVKKAAEMGFSRVVLSRELPESQISYICKNSPLEIEAFIHGALCMCYSGQCYMSSVIGERSGNRGKCAQPCRQKYQNGYELSLKDLCTAKDFVAFKKCGVHSLKIEGRMKSPDYVYGVVSIYRKLIDENRNASDNEMKTLAELFSREGFTNAYFKDNPSEKMFGVRTDADKKLTRNVSVEYAEKKILTRGVFEAKKDKELRLILTAFGKTAEAKEQPPFVAQKITTTKKDCEKQLLKMGETSFELQELECIIDDGLFIPVGTLNRLRRECVTRLEDILTEVNEKEFKSFNINDYETEQENRKIAFCNTNEQAEAIADSVDEIRLPLHLIKENYMGKVVAVLPDIIFDRETEEIKNKLLAVRELKINSAVCGNIGQIKLLKELGFLVHGDTGLNIYNSESVKKAKELGLSSATLSFELNTAQIRDIKKSLLVNSIVYGRYKVMTIQNCLMKNRGECINFKGYSTLTDKTGRSFVVFCNPPHRNIIYNSVPLYLGDKPELIADCGKVFVFTTESGKEAKRILMMYEEKEEYKGEFTRGFSKKKV